MCVCVCVCAFTSFVDILISVLYLHLPPLLPSLPYFPPFLFSNLYYLYAIRIKEKCEQILVLSCSHRRKSEELLWRKVFYEVISYCKKYKVVHINSVYYGFLHVLSEWSNWLTTVTSFWDH